MPQPHPTPADIERAIRNIPDFPKPGIQFKDITPVLADPRLFAASVDLLIERFKPGMVCLLYTSPSPRDRTRSRMPSSA